ncbi:MAG TPA: TetR/AcrR family transcriptional regulator [Galbitalea sp.]|jgi:AcrR family transcriptional regulator|nr:TetR/AcrR family transcriptional regulator [Galbitalea sp.]
MTATRRRGAELEAAVLEAAWDILSERGYGALTYEALAQQAKTAKQVIYRRWPTKRELLFALLEHHGKSLPSIEVDTGSLREDVLTLMRNSSSRLSDLTAIFSGLIGTHFDEVEATPRELRAALFGNRANAVEAALERAVARGEMGAGEIPARVVAVPYDLYRHEAVMSLASMPDEVLVEIVDQVWLPLVGQYAGSSKTQK